MIKQIVAIHITTKNGDIATQYTDSEENVGWESRQVAREFTEDEKRQFDNVALGYVDFITFYSGTFNEVNVPAKLTVTFI